MGDKLFSTTDLESLVRHVAEGRTISKAAEALEFSPTTIYRHLKNDPDWRDRVSEARDVYRDKIRDKRRQIAFHDGHPDQFKALQAEAKAHLPEDRETRHLEVSGGARPIQIEGRRVVTLADVFALANEVEALDADPGTGGARPALPAASEVLAEPGESQ